MTGTVVAHESKTPVPLGVRAETGAARPPLTEDQALLITSPPPLVAARSEEAEVLAVASSVDDATDLTQTGWGVLFASDADPRIKEQLQPLLDLRKKQVQDPKLFRIFEGAAGVGPGMAAATWAMNRGVSLAAPVDPRKGVPYYLMIVGSLERIPFEFQALIDLQWAVGRLHFDDIEDYGRYAQKVVEYEDPAFRPVQHKSTAAWLTRNPLDIATAMLSSAIIEDFAGENKLGDRRGFGFNCFSGDQASKQQLQDILRGNIAGGPPALVFTGSHGAEWPIGDPAQQRKFQGALVTQAWSSGKPLDSTNQFTGDDLPADDKLHGMMAFLFACYSGGCPKEDNFFYNEDGSKIEVAPAPLVARLPQAMLSRGALAVIAHVDRAFTYTFEDLMGTPQCETLRTPLDLLMKGQPIGLAADALNLQWSTLAAQLGVAMGGNTQPAKGPQPPFITNLYIARDDARNYTVLGDPATRLRVKDLS